MDKVKIWCVLLFVMGLSSANTLHAASDYVLDPDKSSLYFVSTKQIHVVENHTFQEMSGSISEIGSAQLRINLSSVDTGIAIRNQRVRDLLFEVASFAEAIVTLPVDTSGLAALGVGSSQTQAISASLTMHGVTAAVDTEVVVTRLSTTSLMVQSASPILISAGDYNLAGGVDALRNIANLDVISYTVPVNFTLVFSAP